MKLRERSRCTMRVSPTVESALNGGGYPMTTKCVGACVVGRGGAHAVAAFDDQERLVAADVRVRRPCRTHVRCARPMEEQRAPVRVSARARAFMHVCARTRVCALRVCVRLRVCERTCVRCVCVRVCVRVHANVHACANAYHPTSSLCSHDQHRASRAHAAAHPPTSVPLSFVNSPMQSAQSQLHKDWAHPFHIGTGTGLAPAHADHCW